MHILLLSDPYPDGRAVCRWRAICRDVRHRLDNAPEYRELRLRAVWHVVWLHNNSLSIKHVTGLDFDNSRGITSEGFTHGMESVMNHLGFTLRRDMRGICQFFEQALQIPSHKKQLLALLSSDILNVIKLDDRQVYYLLYFFRPLCSEFMVYLQKTARCSDSGIAWWIAYNTYLLGHHRDITGDGAFVFIRIDLQRALQHHQPCKSDASPELLAPPLCDSETKSMASWYRQRLRHFVERSCANLELVYSYKKRVWYDPVDAYAPLPKWNLNKWIPQADPYSPFRAVKYCQFGEMECRDAHGNTITTKYPTPPGTCPTHGTVERRRPEYVMCPYCDWIQLR